MLLLTTLAQPQPTRMLASALEETSGGDLATPAENLAGRET
jgi:hypothetical protein